tara:strand:- start:939 stop:1073 length:135 start_codon:yes stop_codon:yes gene_type:complete
VAGSTLEASYLAHRIDISEEKKLKGALAAQEQLKYQAKISTLIQ